MLAVCWIDRVLRAHARVFLCVTSAAFIFTALIKALILIIVSFLLIAVLIILLLSSASHIAFFVLYLRCLPFQPVQMNCSTSCVSLHVRATSKVSKRSTSPSCPTRHASSPSTPLSPFSFISTHKRARAKCRRWSALLSRSPRSALLWVRSFSFLFLSLSPSLPPLCPHALPYPARTHAYKLTRAHTKPMPPWAVLLSSQNWALAGIDEHIPPCGVRARYVGKSLADRKQCQLFGRRCFQVKRCRCSKSAQLSV